MNNNKDGGPAFPVDAPWHGRGMYGMTLRDYFAAAVIGQLVVNGYSNKLAVKQAYKCADFMLAERARKGAQP